MVEGGDRFFSLFIPDEDGFVTTCSSNSFTIKAQGYCYYHILVVEGSDRDFQELQDLGTLVDHTLSVEEECQKTPTRSVA